MSTREFAKDNIDFGKSKPFDISHGKNTLDKNNRFFQDNKRIMNTFKPAEQE